MVLLGLPKLKYISRQSMTCKHCDEHILKHKLSIACSWWNYKLIFGCRRTPEKSVEKLEAKIVSCFP